VLASDVPENREAMGDAGFTFRRGDADDLTDRLRFLIANPAVRQAAGKMARIRVREHYLWQDIAIEVEKAYFKVMELPVPERRKIETWKPETQRKKPNSSVAAPIVNRKIASGETNTPNKRRLGT
jgi:hypothetical protein